MTSFYERKLESERVQLTKAWLDARPHRSGISLAEICDECESAVTRDIALHALKQASWFSRKVRVNGVAYYKWYPPQCRGALRANKGSITERNDRYQVRVTCNGVRRSVGWFIEREEAEEALRLALAAAERGDPFFTQAEIRKPGRPRATEAARKIRGTAPETRARVQRWAAQVPEQWANWVSTIQEAIEESVK